MQTMRKRSGLTGFSLCLRVFVVLQRDASPLLTSRRCRSRGGRTDVAQRAADDVVVLRHVEMLATFRHLLLELLVVERDAHAEVDEHVRDRAVAGPLPVARIGN